MTLSSKQFPYQLELSVRGVESDRWKQRVIRFTALQKCSCIMGKGQSAFTEQQKFSENVDNKSHKRKTEVPLTTTMTKTVTTLYYAIIYQG